MAPSRSSPAAPPLYAGVVSDLTEAIASGRYVVGSLLPTEHELADHYAVSRQTIRAALRVLQDRGFISRKKGVGSRVESADPDRGYFQSIAALDDLVRVAAVEVRAISSVESVTLDRAAARRLLAPLGSRWLVFTGLRVDRARDNRPVSFARIYVDARYPEIEQKVLANPTVLVSALLEPLSGQPIVEARQEVSGTLIDEALAAQLDAPVGSPALRILRHYKTEQSSILEITESIYPADRMSLSMRLRRVTAEGRPE